jgi:hypothetical protein
MPDPMSSGIATVRNIGGVVGTGISNKAPRHNSSLLTAAATATANANVRASHIMVRQQADGTIHRSSDY